MADVIIGTDSSSKRLIRWAVIGTLVLALVLVDVYDEAILLLLTTLWKKALSALGLGQQAQALQSGINSGITKRFLPAVATYAALYLALCLLLLRALLSSSAQWLLALRLYFMVLVVYAALLLLAKAANAVWAYKLSRDILDFVVSPVPVVGLYLFFRTSFGLASAGPRKAPTTGANPDAQ
ncbi:hypothetical protein I2I05_03055 [Hymenobacter sp. BT683]|uniref:DUF2569 domain-containing protein n=1 Tax=Hymenobacter jeongseonensis TaxID=2791027 RepID=A0ABS0IDC7_9BACT|nr:hypothetical protein [Hymenobacter jeongseonensis]MBF9236364.1 hypothetical protein [Hymenobacter jeongseonensis]